MVTLSRLNCHVPSSVNLPLIRIHFLSWIRIHIQCVNQAQAAFLNVDPNPEPAFKNL